MVNWHSEKQKAVVELFWH